jgi:ribosome-associated translation inhibitor RaiA
MMSISFKNLEPSELTRETVEARVLAIVEKFPDLDESNVKIVLEMKNSRLQAGPDLFSIQLNIFSGRYEGIKITKSSANLYAA